MSLSLASAVVPAEGEMDTRDGLFCSQMSLAFCCHVLMDAHVSLEVERNVVLQSACSKSMVLIAAMSQCAHESIMMVGQVHVTGALTGIRYQDEILQHHINLHLDINSRVIPCQILTPPYVAKISNISHSDK